MRRGPVAQYAETDRAAQDDGGDQAEDDGDPGVGAITRCGANLGNETPIGHNIASESHGK